MIKDDRLATPVLKDQRWSCWAGAFVVVLLFLFTGCAQQRYIRLRERPQGVFGNPLKLLTQKPPRPTPRTLQLLRRYDLVSLQDKNPEATLARLQHEVESDPNPDKI